MKYKAIRIVPICVALAGAWPAVAQCPDQWYPLFGVPPGTDNTVRAATTWDPDGSGPLTPQLVIGGGFLNAGGALVQSIARFDGTMWLPFGAGTSTGFNGAVRALIVWDPDGSGPLPEQLVAAGDFTQSGSTVLNRVARWDGSAWQPFDAGLGATATSV